MLIRTRINKTLICIAMLIFTAALASCGKKKTEEFTFRATVTEIQNGSMLVTPTEGSDELRSSDSFLVKIENMPSSPEPEVGDIVEITYDGGIQETYPAGLNHVFSIVVVEKAAASGSSPGSTMTIESCIPEKSILWFQDNEEAKKLIEDMNDGNIPQECNVLYDEMGSRPEVTVTDAETITDLYNRLALMSVGEKSQMSITDSYHHIRFTLQDGTTVGWNFEGKDLLNIGTENYDVKDEGDLWFAVRQLQEKAMGNEEVIDYEESDDGQQDAFVRGPYGEISVDVPAGWSAKACHVDEEGMMYGLYGLILKPESEPDGQIELFCSDTFGVCGTGLVQEEIMLAGGKAIVGTYDEHENWDYITFGEADPNKASCQIVAQHTDCDSWTEEMWEEAILILDTMRFDPAKTEGGIGQYIPESENDEIAVNMEALHVIPTGCIIRFRQYDRRDTGELIYGQGFMLEKKDGDSWEAVPMIVDDAVFTEEGYTIPREDESEIETDWQWLYGVLDPGTYRISKTVIDHRDNGNKEYTLFAQFLIA